MADLQSYTQKGGSTGAKSSSSTHYDFSGLDEQIKRQDSVDGLRGEKFASLYNGDVAGSVGAGGRIRSLLGIINSQSPGATERNPHSEINPLVKVSATSTSSDSDIEDPSYGWEMPPRTPAPAPTKNP